MESRISPRLTRATASQKGMRAISSLFGFIGLRGRFGKIPRQEQSAALVRDAIGKIHAQDFRPAIGNKAALLAEFALHRFEDGDFSRSAAFGDLPTVNAKREAILPHEDDVAVFIDGHDARCVLLEMNFSVHARAASRA